jgi:hypothetical protein
LGNKDKELIQEIKKVNPESFVKAIIDQLNYLRCLAENSKEEISIRHWNIFRNYLQDVLNRVQISVINEASFHS